MNIGNNENSLIAAAVKNDRKAQHSIYEKYSGRLLSLCRSFTPDIQEAEDILLKSFFKIFKNLHTFRNEGSFEKWMKRIVINEAINFQKRKSIVDRTKSVDEQIIVQETESSLDMEYWQLLIDRLPQNLKQAFILSVLEGYSHAEISDMFNISTNASKQRVKRAKMMLREMDFKRKNISNGF